jgi:hypothetical protein
MNYTPDVGIQELSYPYTLQLYEPPPPMNVSDGTSLFCSPTSPCTSSSLSESPSSSQPWSDSESSPTPCQYSDDAVPSVTPVPQPILPPPAPVPAPTQPLEAPARPPYSKRPLPTPPVVESPRQDVLSRRAPKQRRITRAVQPLACYFCRGRKIACGPPADLSSGNRTCEYVVAHKNIHLHSFIYQNPPTIITIIFIVSC